MSNYSLLSYILAIYNAAVFHRKNCKDVSCEISLAMLKRAAVYISKSKNIPFEDRDEIEQMLRDWPS